MSVLKIKDAEGNWVGVTAIQGEQGEDGYSPVINVNTNTNSTYKLKITTKDKEFVTPNLKGSGGSGGSGNISSELGTIDNYKDFEGRNIPTYNSNMPPLQCFPGGTTYVFDKEVTMLVYNGDIDDNGNVDIDKYVSFTGKEITVPTTYYGTLTDYLIYNPVPKKEWDTWENPNIVKFMEYDDPAFFVKQKLDFSYDTVTTRAYELPNLKLNGNSTIDNATHLDTFKSGDAYICYDVYYDELNKKYYTKKGSYSYGVYNRRDFPFVLDEPVMCYPYDVSYREFTNGYPVPYPSPTWEGCKSNYPAFCRGKDYLLIDDLTLVTCDATLDGIPILNGNETLMELAEYEQPILESEEYDNSYDLVVADPYWIKSKLHHYNAQPTAPLMAVGLAAGSNYTLETLAGDCAIILTDKKTKNHITTEKEVVCYPTTTKVVAVNGSVKKETGTNKDKNSVGGNRNETVYEDGKLISYDYIDSTRDPIGKIDIPCALTCPYIYIRKGESYTFTVDDDDKMLMIYVACWNEEDYQGIKIVEGIEPYSSLMAERMASGATKFNVKTYWTPGGEFDVDDDKILQEFNIKLTDNTTEKDYCRFLNNDTIKHFDLDDFTMDGHTHTMAHVTDKEEFVQSLKVPTMTLSTSTLTDGVSELPENTFYFVYEE